MLTSGNNSFADAANDSHSKLLDKINSTTTDKTDALTQSRHSLKKKDRDIELDKHKGSKNNNKKKSKGDHSTSNKSKDLDSSTQLPADDTLNEEKKESGTRRPIQRMSTITGLVFPVRSVKTAMVNESSAQRCISVEASIALTSYLEIMYENLMETCDHHKTISKKGKLTTSVDDMKYAVANSPYFSPYHHNMIIMEGSSGCETNVPSKHQSLQSKRLIKKILNGKVGVKPVDIDSDAEATPKQPKSNGRGRGKANPAKAKGSPKKTPNSNAAAAATNSNKRKRVADPRKPKPVVKKRKTSVKKKGNTGK